MRWVSWAAAHDTQHSLITLVTGVRVTCKPHAQQHVRLASLQEARLRANMLH